MRGLTPKEVFVLHDCRLGAPQDDTFFERDHGIPQSLLDGLVGRGLLRITARYEDEIDGDTWDVEEYETTPSGMRALRLQRIVEATP